MVFSLKCWPTSSNKGLCCPVLDVTLFLICFLLIITVLTCFYKNIYYFSALLFIFFVCVCVCVCLCMCVYMLICVYCAFQCL